MRHARCTPWILTLVAVAACGDAPGAGGALSAPAWTLEGPTLRIGSIDDPDYAFGTPRALALAPDGSIYSMHSGEAMLRRWTAEGLPAGTVGREGQGPGEFERLLSFGFFGDSLWAFDLGSYRFSYFDLDGAFTGSVRPNVNIGRTAPGLGPAARPERPFRDGTLLGKVPAFSNDIATGQLTEVPFVRMDAEGAALSTLWTQHYETSDVLAVRNSDGVGGMYGEQPFGDEPITQALEDGLVVLDRRAWSGEGGAAFALTRIGLSGDTLWRRRLEYSPETLPSQVVDSAVAARVEGLSEFISRVMPGVSRGEFEQRFQDAVHAPAYLPPIKEMVVAENGAIWLSRWEPDDQGGVEWWVLDASGEPIGRASAPAELRVLLITDDAVWGVETDDLDVGYIVRYRLVTET